MPAARRVVLGTRSPLPDAEILHRSRYLCLPSRPLRPGDEVAGLVVLRVDPDPGTRADGDTCVDVEAQPFGHQDERLDVVALLDAGESMGQRWHGETTRLEGAKEALRRFAEQPGVPLRSLTLLAIGRTPRLLAAASAPAEAVRAARDLKARGPARTAEALDAALAHLAARAPPTGRPVVLLLSDAPGQEKALVESTRRAERLGVPVHVLVFSHEVDPLYTSLAVVTGGSIQTAHSPPAFAFRKESFT